MMDPVESSEIPHENLPGLVFGGLWVVSGVVGIAFGLRETGRDSPGFLAVAFPPIMVAASYGVSWVTWLLSGGEHGWRLGIFGALIYALLTALVGLLASWPETPNVNGGDDG